MGDKNVHISKLQIDSQIPREISKSIEDKNVHIYKLLIDSQIPRETNAIVDIMYRMLFTCWTSIISSHSFGKMISLERTELNILILSIPVVKGGWHISKKIIPRLYMSTF